KDIEKWEIHILVVDDNSPDSTAEEIVTLQKKYKKLFLLKSQKEGLGKAYTKGFKYAFEHIRPDVIFEMDADWSHNPKDIPNFLSAIEKGSDFVIGSRYRKGGSIPQDWPIHRKVLSIFANLIVRLGFMKPRITEWTNGYRAIRSWIVKAALPHLENYTGYVFQIAFLDFAIKNNAVISEVPVKFTDRVDGKSKMSSIQYITNTLFYVFTNSPFIRFAIVGGVGFIIDFGLSYILIEKRHLAVWLSTVISAETAIISNFLLNNFWSFSHKKLESKASVFINKFVRFNFIAVVSILIQSTTLHFATEKFGQDYWYIYKIIIIALVIIPYSYFTYNRLIWKKK
ncbi:MAG TPA: GtrA family protein, partial [Candidatus Nitrosocosmicus sp.]|nr:GtrA family protein [Candidatus Nitrosocosmicus sp.]